MTIKLNSDERIDDLQRNGYKIIQNSKKFCFGMDAVLLTGFAHANSSDKLLDIGTGTGIIPILMEAKYGLNSLVALEVQEESADMARRSVLLNGLEDKISIVHGDINDSRSLFENEQFDIVITNPPYMIDEHGLKSENEAKMIARHEVLCTLEDIISHSSRLLKNGGNFFMVHRPFRLAEIIDTMKKYDLEPKRMQFVHSYIDKDANMVLIEGKKGARSRVTIEKPIIIYKEPNVYTDEIYDIYGY